MTDIVELSNEKLNVEDVSKSVTLPNCGAVSLFIGTTRDHFDGKEVLSLQYEAYHTMAKKKMFEICQDIRNKWNVGKIALVHRLGNFIGTVHLSGKKIQNTFGRRKDVAISKCSNNLFLVINSFSKQYPIF
ncbi:molybdopterin synthase catalytic subunit isoform X2 [Octopus sinensis]|uniref:Molybdopterin synthase catalytic subunit isoform X2 n=1 Tax=Octopus sinensis TaxID=2607531 RepID=A0A7E6F253_9MOLL|nr:molybdopterin synthase catalytic subunit isoform X2 [Octopus sinensis]